MRWLAFFFVLALGGALLLALDAPLWAWALVGLLIGEVLYQGGDL